MSTYKRLPHRDQYLPAIRWENQRQRFLCADEPLPLRKLGSLIAHAISKGEKEIRLGFELHESGSWRRLWSVAFSVDYLLSMLAFVGEHGWFWDAVEKGDDHAFDAQRITPGVHWAQVELLEGMADSLTKCVARHSGEGCNSSMSAEFSANARKISAQSKRLLRLDVPSTGA